MVPGVGHLYEGLDIEIAKNTVNLYAGSFSCLQLVRQGGTASTFGDWRASSHRELHFFFV